MRAELRFTDPSCNPYIAFAGMIASLSTASTTILPLQTAEQHQHLSPERGRAQSKGITELPSSLLEALEALDNDTVLKNALGEEIYTAFRRAKLEEWDDFRIHVTDWKLKNTWKVPDSQCVGKTPDSSSGVFFFVQNHVPS